MIGGNLSVACVGKCLIRKVKMILAVPQPLALDETKGKLQGCCNLCDRTKVTSARKERRNDKTN